MAWRASEAFLRDAFRGTVGVVLAAAAYAIPAPGAGQRPLEIPLLHGQIRCLDGEEIADAPYYIRPNTPLDYLALRNGGELVSAVGLPCRGATRRAACTAALAEATHARNARTTYLVGTRGDSVLVWQTVDEWAALMRPIDDAAEASIYIAIHLQGQEVLKCPQPSKASSGGFDFMAREYTRPAGKRDPSGSPTVEGVDYDLRLHGDGRIEKLLGIPFKYRDGYDVMEGRRPPGMISSGPRGRGLGQHFGRAAMHEAASVHAFEQLAAELDAHGGGELADRARMAAQDERRHALQMGELACRFGGTPERARVPRTPLRSLEEIALDNAVEGCVNETFAAQLATYQACRAQDSAVAHTLSTIAEDETRHAALSWDLDVWLRGRLDADARARMDAAGSAEIERLRLAQSADLSEQQLRTAGVPSGAQRRGLIDVLEGQVWRS